MYIYIYTLLIIINHHHSVFIANSESSLTTMLDYSLIIITVTIV